jgi:uncharacterized protein YceH (UPF0502 family)
MSITLKPNEVRVLGVLIEKSMTTPQYYPMTLNAVTLASNQKNNRDPLLSLTEGEVGAALHELQRWQLVTQPGPEPGSRANKFRHEVEKRFGWTPSQRAVMCELLIRGPQTLNALRSNTSRMKQFDSIESLREVLAELERTDPPMVTELPRQPGRREIRFAQLLGGPIVESAPLPLTHTAERQEQYPSEPRVQPSGDAALAGRVETLEHRVTAVQSELDSLRETLRTAGLL